MWTPNLDTYASDDGFLIKCELSGLKPTDLQLTVSGRQILIHGQRHDDSQPLSGATAAARQIQYGHFEATIEVPERYDLANASAHYQNGFLRIHVPAGDGRALVAGVKRLSLPIDPSPAQAMPFKRRPSLNGPYSLGANLEGVIR